MKILHTADWHLGHRLHEHSQIEEQILFLSWIENYITVQQIDVLLISGDVFDTGSPSNQSLELYYSFLVKLNATTCHTVIITGGNHDSPGTLNAPKQILNALSIKVVGKATESIGDEVFEIECNGEKVIIGAVPYLRDQDIRRAVAGESFDELTDRYKKALTNHYNELAEYCETINTTNAPVIAMGHLFAIGGSVSDSEQNIYVGTLGHIGANDFSDTFDYVALGHLHRPQIVGGNDKIRYSGSPHILGFSELNYEKKIFVLTIEDNKISKVDSDIVPRFREFFRLIGSKDQVIEEFPNITSNAYELTPFVEIVLDEITAIGNDELKKQAELYQFEILKTTLKKQREHIGIEEQLKHIESIKELLPENVFEIKCKEQGFDLEANPEIMDAFNEILQGVKEGNSKN
jgi:exonuclease SbcD